MDLGQSFQAKYAQDKQLQADTQTHDELLTGFDRVQAAVVKSGVAQIQALDTKVDELGVIVKESKPDTIRTPDVRAVVKEVVKLQKLIKQQPDDAATVGAVKSLLPALNTIISSLTTLPAKIDIPEPLDNISVNNFDELKPLLETLVTVMRLKNFNPQINLPAPEVTVTPADLSVLEAKLDRLFEAIASIHFEVPVDDDTAIVSGLTDVKNTINSLVFPVPNVVTDPLIRYKVTDIDDVGTVRYYGHIDPVGNWYILQEDTAAKTYRYATGSGSYPTKWTGRAGLTYGYLSEMING